ncbi:MAG: hypothetical protein J0J01_32385 [Reyranella sp.]|uniref:hypothetical protein n=1 Tax=Reyranella sp. TaxID=1929291 RepID=UPI001ACDFA07|nr:hypothetical protein [Reyranella sp.]MBN9091644.1 hypothetical protein [Reyranella sp.]
MAVSAPVITPAPAAVVATAPPRSVQWGAVILGALGATAISMVLLTFGAGIGLSAASAHPYAGASAKALAVISALYAAVSIVAAFAAGGYITGRMRLPATEDDIAEADFRDGAHGFGVWALALVVGGAVAASGAAGVLKTAMQTTAAVASGAAANPANQISMNPTDYAVDRILAPAPAGGAPGAAMQTASRADLAAPVTRIFAASIKSGQLDPRDRTTLVAIVQQQTGLPQAEAEKRVDEANTELKTAEQKIRDTAEAARKAALITAFGVAATLLLGCAAACAGAGAGAKHRHERVAITWFGSRRFW